MVPRITENDLIAISPLMRKKAKVFLEPLNDTMEKYDILENYLRVSAFIAQIAHESGCFIYVKELASGRAYEGRRDLGNIYPGDGVKYKGHGLIQITGRTNHARVSKALGIDAINNPLILTEPKWAAMSAGWFWDERRLNILADGKLFRVMTKAINGGYNGIKEREIFYSNALQHFGV